MTHIQTPYMSSTDSFADSKHYAIQGDDHSTALQLLQQASCLSVQELKQAAQNGSVWIKRNAKAKPERLRRLKKALGKQQSIDFYYNPEVLQQTVSEPQLIEDKQDYSVWLKPRGMLSQGSKWSDHTALYRWVEMHYRPDDNSRQCWIVHRLDRATCGLMLLAHSKQMASRLSRLFEQNQIHKTYQALVWGLFPGQTQTVTNEIDGKPAVSHITLLKLYPNHQASRVEIKIETGRKHQIRRHLVGLGYPIVGDRLYGNEQLEQSLPTRPDLQLTAYQLEFECPLSGELKSYQLAESQLDLLEWD